MCGVQILDTIHCINALTHLINSSLQLHSEITYIGPNFCLCCTLGSGLHEWPVANWCINGPSLSWKAWISWTLRPITMRLWGGWRMTMRYWIIHHLMTDDSQLTAWTDLIKSIVLELTFGNMEILFAVMNLWRLSNSCKSLHDSTIISWWAWMCHVAPEPSLLLLH